MWYAALQTQRSIRQSMWGMRPIQSIIGEHKCLRSRAAPKVCRKFLPAVLQHVIGLTSGLQRTLPPSDQLHVAAFCRRSASGAQPGARADGRRPRHARGRYISAIWENTDTNFQIPHTCDLGVEHVHTPHTHTHVLTLPLSGGWPAASRLPGWGVLSQ